VPDIRAGPLAGAGPRGGRGRRHLLVAGFVLAYLGAGAVVLAMGDRVAGGGWLALHLALLGAATNAIVVWSEHFAAALLRAPPAGGRIAATRALALNLGILAVLGGVHGGRTALAAAGACLAGVVVLGHALMLVTRIGRSLPSRLGGTVWFYLAAAAALQAEVAEDRAGHGGGQAPEVGQREERLPAAAQVAAGRGAGDPDRVAVDDPEGQEHRGRGVADQGGVEVAQPPAAQVDGQCDQGGGDPASGRRHPATASWLIHVE
jgi:hypothetical protein